MLEIKVLGRGGQGVGTSGELLAVAAMSKGSFAYAFPSLGSERKGAPVAAFCRVDNKKINIRSKIYTPDVVIVLDPGLLKLMDPTDGLRDNGLLILNTPKDVKEIKTIKTSARIVAVDADKIATEELGRPIVNTTMLGPFIKATRLIAIEDMKEQLTKRFGPKLGEANFRALSRAYQEAQVKE